MKKILCTLCIAAAFVSCNLDEFPLDKLAPENYFNNEEELKTFTNTFYQQNFPEAGAIYSESADVIIIVTTLQSEVSGTAPSSTKAADGIPEAGSRSPISTTIFTIRTVAATRKHGSATTV